MQTFLVGFQIAGNYAVHGSAIGIEITLIQCAEVLLLMS